VFELIIKPIIFGCEADQHPGFSAAADDNLLVFRLTQKPREVVAAWMAKKRARQRREMLWGERRGDGTIVAVDKPTGVPHAESERPQPMPHRS